MALRNPAPYLHLCPRAVATANLHQLNLSAHEALLWSRADGSMTLTQLADIAGRPVAEVFDMLGSLQGRGVIVWPDAAPVQAVAGTALGPSARAALPPDLATHPALQEAGDLSREERLRILVMETQLATRTFWEILGVGAQTSAADVKKAYFRASKAYHPDRFFGRKLGSFASRLERIFAHIKLASDTLTDAEARAEYLQAHPEPAPQLAPERPPKAAPAPAPVRDPRLEEHRASLKGGRASLKLAHAERAARQAYRAKNLTGARIWAEQAVQLAPDELRLRLMAAEVCEALGDVAGARKHLEHAASLDKQNVDVKNGLARLSHGKSDRH